MIMLLIAWLKLQIICAQHKKSTLSFTQNKYYIAEKKTKRTRQKEKCFQKTQSHKISSFWKNLWQV